MPTTSAGFDGFTDFSLSGVRRRSPAMRRSYSRPNWARTAAKAASMACKFAREEESVYGSFRNSTANCLETGMLPFRSLDTRETDFAIVPQTAGPMFIRRFSQPARLHLDTVEWKQVEGRDPGGRQVREGRHEVGEETECLASTRCGHQEHVPIVAGRKMSPDAGDDLALVRLDELHLSGVDQRIIIRIDIADGVARIPLV